jgi:hypothetical protein
MIMNASRVVLERVSKTSQAARDRLLLCIALLQGPLKLEILLLVCIP